MIPRARLIQMLNTSLRRTIKPQHRNSHLLSIARTAHLSFLVRPPIGNATITPSQNIPIKNEVSPQGILDQDAWVKIYKEIEIRNKFVDNDNEARRNYSILLKLADCFRLYNIDPKLFASIMTGLKHAELLLLFFTDTVLPKYHKLNFTFLQLEYLSKCSYDQLKGIKYALEAAVHYNEHIKDIQKLRDDRHKNYPPAQKPLTLDNDLISKIIRSIKTERAGKSLSNIVDANSVIYSRNRMLYDPDIIGSSFLGIEDILSLIENNDNTILNNLFLQCYLNLKLPLDKRLDSVYFVSDIRSIIKYRSTGDLNLHHIEFMLKKIKEAAPSILKSFIFSLIEDKCLEKLSSCTNDESELEAITDTFILVPSTFNRYRDVIIKTPNFAQLRLQLLKKAINFQVVNQINLRNLEDLIVRYPGQCKKTLDFLFKICEIFSPASDHYALNYSIGQISLALNEIAVKSTPDVLKETIEIIEAINSITKYIPEFCSGEDNIDTLGTLLKNVLSSSQHNNQILTFIQDYQNKFHPTTVQGLKVFCIQLNVYINSLNPKPEVVQTLPALTSEDTSMQFSWKCLKDRLLNGKSCEVRVKKLENHRI